MTDPHLIEAVQKALKSSKKRKFLESIELAINLKDVDLSDPRNRIQEDIILPNGRGRPVKVGLFGSSEMAVKAKDIADIIIQPEQIEEIAETKAKAKKMLSEFDFFVAEAPLMPVIGKRLGVILGTSGRMPRPIPPGSDPTGIINNLKKSVRVRTKDRKTFHVPIGTRDMSASDLAENLDVILKRVTAKLERGKMNIQSAYIKTTMGPAVAVI
ncbi:MAG TPA: 50S ribosomal protein L1 [Euryarchaeota archaeon]|nr:50S ribosomal protein L1 [Euryarchaeota archaeon]